MPEVAAARRAAGVVVVAAVVLGTLQVSGGGVLALPAPDESWTQWLAVRHPVTLAFVVLRFGAHATAWYLLVVTTVAAAAAAAGSLRLAALSRRIATPPVRRLLQPLLGLTLAASALPAAAEPATARTVAAARAEGAAPPLPPPPAQPAPPPPGAPTLHRGASSSAPAPAATNRTWVVQPGDHFWSIARTHLERTRGGTPSQRQTARYWRRLIEHNRHRLVDPRNADLLFPGQTLELPPQH